MIEFKLTNGFISVPAMFFLFLGMLITPLITNAQNVKSKTVTAQKIAIDIYEVSYSDGFERQNAMNSVAHTVLADFENAFSLSYTNDAQPEFRVQTYPIRHNVNIGNLTPADGFLRDKIVDYDQYGISFMDVILETAISLPQAIIGGNRFMNRQLNQSTNFTNPRQLPTLPDRD